MTSDFPGDLHRFSSVMNDVTRNLDIARTCDAVACAYTNVCTRVDRRRRGGQRYSPSALRQLQCCDGCTWEGGGGGREADREDVHVSVCTYMRIVQERGVAAPPCVVNRPSLYFSQLPHFGIIFI